MKLSFLLYNLLFSILSVSAQHYQALHGSNFSGSLGVHNNPASIVNTPYKWDLTLFGIQAQVATNIVTTDNYSIFSPARQSQYTFKRGTYERKAAAMANINLLNARFAIDRKKAVAFGVNIRAHAATNTSSYFFIDSIKNVGAFLQKNPGNQPLSMDFIHSGWIEVYGTYAQTLLDNGFSRVNAGFTLKASRGLSGAQAQLQNGRFQPNTLPANPAPYLITKGDTRFGYSSNYDKWQKNNSRNQNLQDFFTYTQGGAAIEGGIELLIKTQAVTDIYDDDDYFDYRWKLGLSLLDLGANQYKYGTNSRFTTGVRPNITNSDINQKFDTTVTNLKIFMDSLATIAGQMSGLSGIFRIMNPARLVFNADYFIQGSYYINAELSLNLSPLAGKKRLFVKDMSRVTVTPRWESRQWGVYLPVSFNAANKLWIGGAAKAGPLLLGFHNLAYIFSKKSIQNGGGYIAIIIRSWNDTGKKKNKELDCPPGTFR